MQKIPKHCYDIGWGGTGGQLPLNGGDFSIFTTFGADSVRIPLSCGGTFSNLSVWPNAAANPTCTFTLAVNGVATDLAVTLPAGVLVPITDTSHTVTTTAGDDASLLITGANNGAPAGDAGFCLTFEPTDPTLSTYGVAPFSGAVTNGSIRAAGAFGNGAWSGDPGTGQAITYSIACVPGTVTRLDIKSFRGTFTGGNTFTCYLRKNGVVQDGTGGTVNTAVVLDGASTSTSGTFSLPVSVQDLIEFYAVYAGSDLTFALANFGVSCLFQAAAANTFHWCGGNNDAISTSDPTYHWIGSEQNTNTDESTTKTPVGPVGFTATALYVQHDSAGTAPAATYTDTLRVNGVSSAQSIVVPQTTTAATGLNTTAVVLNPNDLIDVEIIPANTPVGAEFHWGVALTASTTPPTPTPTPTQDMNPTDKKQWVLYRFDLKPREEQTS